MNTSPLAGLSIVVARPRDQASTLVGLLEAAGAVVVEVPAIRIIDPDDGGLMLNRAVRSLGQDDWLVVTSPNGAGRVAAAVAQGGLAAGVLVAAIGPATRERAESAGLSVALVPERSIAEGLLEVFPRPPLAGGRVVLARAEQARETLPEGLRSMGWSVDDIPAYRTVAVPVDDTAAAACRGADVVAFTSSSTVSHLVDAVGVEGLPSVIASIGPATSAAVVARGLNVGVEADVHSVPGLVASLVARFGG